MPAMTAEELASARTLLYVPGHRPDRFAKAAASQADGIILDLEDAVGPDHKDEARENVRRWLAEGGTGAVRINSADTPWFDEDLAALGELPVAVLLPKASSAAEVMELRGRLPAGSCVMPILETAAGVLDARSICGAPGVVRAAFGNGDLANELGIDHADLSALAHARSMVVLASAAAGVAPPLDGVTTTVNDEAQLEIDTRHGAALGFTGKACIHPSQVAVVHAVLTPSPQEVQWAERVIAAATAGSVALVDGRMIDKPLVEHARRLLARAPQGL